MNFLAHLYFADDTPEHLIGSILPDFVSGQFEVHSKKLRAGMRLHVEIDKFTDQNEIFLRSQQRLGSEYRLLKGIIIDVFYDHFLAAGWTEYSHIPLEKFCEDVYSIFRENQSLLSPRLRKALPHMQRDNWLLSYQRIDGIEIALRRISTRLSRRINLDESVTVLKQFYPDFKTDFQEFFPELSDFVKNKKGAFNNGY